MTVVILSCEFLPDSGVAMSTLFYVWLVQSVTSVLRTNKCFYYDYSVDLEIPLGFPFPFTHIGDRFSRFTICFRSLLLVSNCSIIIYNSPLLLDYCYIVNPTKKTVRICDIVYFFFFCSYFLFLCNLGFKDLFSQRKLKTFLDSQIINIVMLFYLIFF